MDELARIECDGVALVGRAEGAVRFGFTERGGGVSAPPYASLNLGAHVGDDPAAVHENRRRALVLLGAEALQERLLVPNQVHGSHVVVVESAVPAALAAAREEAAAGADAIVCTASGVPVLLNFADCVPVILVCGGGGPGAGSCASAEAGASLGFGVTPSAIPDAGAESGAAPGADTAPAPGAGAGSGVTPGAEVGSGTAPGSGVVPGSGAAPAPAHRPAFAVVHSGWKGTYARIAAAAARELARAAGADVAEVRAYIGPHITGAEYEVSEELLARFQAEFGPVCAGAGPRLLDLAACIRVALVEAGVPASNVHDTGLSTVAENDRFFSYRAEGGRCGRHGALAVML